jgi:hypothetical protein
MRNHVMVAAAAMLLSSAASAQVGLDKLSDKDGYIDAQKITCAQLAGTYQEDADALVYWYSGWYNGLAKKHMYHITRAKPGEHALIVYCKANQNKKVIEALDVLFKEEKAK